MQLHVEALTKEAVSFIHEVFEENRKALHGDSISLNDWYECLLGSDADPFEQHFIVMCGEAPAAWLKLNGLNEEAIGISMLVVAKSYQHKGIGTYALHYAESYARKHKKSAILIQTTKDNATATECYLKHGYCIVREMVYQVGDGIDREGYAFRKDITL